MSKLLYFLSLNLLYLNTIYAQELSVVHCFQDTSYDVLGIDKVTGEESRILFIGSIYGDSTHFRLVKMDAQSNIAWSVEADVQPNWFPGHTDFINFAPWRVYMTNYNEIVLLHQVEISGDIIGLEFYYQVFDLSTGGLLNPSTLIGEYYPQNPEREQFDGISGMQSAGPGKYNLYLQGHVNDPIAAHSAWARQFRIENYTTLAVDPLFPLLSEMPSYPSAHYIDIYRDDSLLLVIHSNKFDLFPSPVTIIAYDNRGDEVSHLILSDTLNLTESSLTVNLLERVADGKYVFQYNFNGYSADTSIEENKLLLLDFQNSTIREISKQAPGSTLVNYSFPPLNFEWPVLQENPFNWAYHPYAPVYYFFPRKIPCSIL